MENFPVTNTKDAFKRAALYQSCKRSQILSNIDYERMNEGELVELVNQHNSHSVRELPIIAVKALTKGLLTFLSDRFPKTRGYINPENIKVTIEDDELAYLINTPSRGSTSIVMIVAKNIAIGALGSSLERLKNDLMRDIENGGSDERRIVEDKLIRVASSNDNGVEKLNLRSVATTPVYDDTFGVQRIETSPPHDRFDNETGDATQLETRRDKRSLEENDGDADVTYAKRVKFIDDAERVVGGDDDFDVASDASSIMSEITEETDNVQNRRDETIDARALPDPPISIERKSNAVDFVDIIASEMPIEYRNVAAREINANDDNANDDNDDFDY